MHHSHSRSEKKQEDGLGARVGTRGRLIAVEDLSNCDLNGQTKNECLSQSDRGADVGRAGKCVAITPDPSFDIFEIAAAATPSLCGLRTTPPHKDLCRRPREITSGGRRRASLSLCDPLSPPLNDLWPKTQTDSSVRRPHAGMAQFCESRVNRLSNRLWQAA